MKNRGSLGALALSLTLVLPGLSNAADVEAGVTAGASYSDNVQLDVSPNELDDIVYQVSPFLKVEHEAPGLDARFDYTFDWFRYDELKSTSKFHRGEAVLTAKAAEETLLADLGARRSQRIGDPNDAIPGGRLLNGGNLVDQDEWWFSPHLTRQFGRSVQLDAAYRYSRRQLQDSRYQDSTNNYGELSLDNYQVGTGVTWALRYLWGRAEFEVSPPWEFQMAGAELGFWVNAKTRVFGAGGQESSWENPFDPSLEDTFWEAGIAHMAGDSLTLELAAGERSFGSSWRGRIDYRFRRGNTSLSYTETPTTPDFNRLGRPANALNPADLDEFLSEPGNAERYVSGRFEWTLGLELRRTELEIRIFDEDRSDRFGADGAVLGDQSQTGAAVNLSWKAGVRTTFVATGSLANRETEIGNKSRYTGAGMGIDYRLGTRSSVSLGYRYHEQQPRGANSTGRDYVANVVALLFTLKI